MYWFLPLVFVVPIGSAWVPPPRRRTPTLLFVSPTRQGGAVKSCLFLEVDGPSRRRNGSALPAVVLGLTVSDNGTSWLYCVKGLFPPKQEQFTNK